MLLIEPMDCEDSVLEDEEEDDENVDENVEEVNKEEEENK